MILHHGLLSYGISSFVCSPHSYEEISNHLTIRRPFRQYLGRALEGMTRRLYPNRRNSPMNFFPGIFGAHADDLLGDFDLLHLHWLGDNFLNLKSLQRVSKPILWTLHDSWAFTGGCHLPLNCQRFTNACGKCPHLNSRHEFDPSWYSFRAKQKILERLPIWAVCPSEWLARDVERAVISRNWKVTVIPNSLEKEFFSTTALDKAKLKAEFNIDADKIVIGIGANHLFSDSNKGWNFIEPLTQELVRLLGHENLFRFIQIVTFGEKAVPSHQALTSFPQLKMKHFGPIIDRAILKKIYGCMDLFLMLSHSENAPLAPLEALSQGTCLIGWDLPAYRTIITKTNSGEVVPFGDLASLARSIKSVLQDPKKLGLIQQTAISTARMYEESVMVKAYIKLYKSALGQT